MIVDKKHKEKLERLVDKGVSIAERTALLVDSLSGIEPKTDLNNILEEVAADVRIVKAAYKELSRDIEKELFVLLTQINDKKIEALKIDVELLSKEKEQNRYCSIYAKVPPLQNLKNEEEYSYFLDKYESGIKLSQQISELNLKVVRLLDIQKALDHAFAGSMIELDYLTRRLNETIKTFRYMKTPDAIENYMNKYCAYKDLQARIETKNREFQEILEKNTRILPKEELSSVKREVVGTN